MTRAVIAGFYFEAFAVTREELIERMDGFAFEALNEIGGAPWRMVTDTTERVQAKTTLADDEGFVYEGARKYVFGGPLVGMPFGRDHDGARPQKSIEDAL